VRVVILAGGLGTRLAEETVVVPKPMVEIGGWPVLWHIMKIYAEQQFGEFVIALGYKGEVIKRYFFDYQALRGSLTIDLATRQVTPHDQPAGNWKIHLVETGADTNTGGRVHHAGFWQCMDTLRDKRQLGHFWTSGGAPWKLWA
jgi:glucose-1-phosphate cytidylyltransferase